MGDDGQSLLDAIQNVRDVLGDAELVDAAAIVANYCALDRVADATGIPLEAAKETNTETLRAEIGIDSLA